MAGISASSLHVSGASARYRASEYANTDGLAGCEGCRTDVGRRYGMGTIRWVGESDALGHGVWAGVELDEKLGKHDGMVFGMRYFVAKDGHGLMTKVEKLGPAKTWEEGDKQVLSKARSNNEKLRKRAGSRNAPRPTSRQEALDGSFADRAFSEAARGGARTATGLAMDDAAKGAAQSAESARHPPRRRRRGSGSASTHLRLRSRSPFSHIYSGTSHHPNLRPIPARPQSI